MDKPTMRVLVLDDDPFMLKLMTRMLNDQGFQQVVACISGRVALQEIDAEGAPDLLFCDLNMPEMDGIEFIRELVSRNFAGQLVLISGVDARVVHTAERLVAAHQIALLGHLTKPFSPAHLAAQIARWTPTSDGEARTARKSYGPEEVAHAISGGHLVNHYQPKVAVATGALMSVEALARWQHPNDGLVMPDQFIATAEEHALIDALTQQVIAASLNQVGRWRAGGLPLRVAVNVSMDNLASLAFPDQVASLAQAAGVPPDALTLEITESRVMKDHRAPLEVLTRLRLKGFHLSIDDFGTGHSSLIQLRDMPFERLKVDRGFVHNAHADRTLRAIYDASLGVARQLGMDVVAEGVETRADWDLLRETRCDLAQGYFIGRPMPAEQLADWQANWQRRLIDERLCSTTGTQA